MREARRLLYLQLWSKGGALHFAFAHYVILYRHPLGGHLPFSPPLEGQGEAWFYSGGYSGGVPPLPIPNREVKPARADGTAHPWESR